MSPVRPNHARKPAPAAAATERLWWAIATLFAAAALHMALATLVALS